MAKSNGVVANFSESRHDGNIEHGVPPMSYAGTPQGPSTGEVAFVDDGIGHGSLDDAERETLMRALDIHGGHREKTADALGISRRTLQYKLKKFGLTRRA